VQEISTKDPQVSNGLRELHAQPAVDILDESDAILSCKQQLVYAWGEQQDLPDDCLRWEVRGCFCTNHINETKPK
jgi:Protein of unknown function (DUF3638)